MVDLPLGLVKEQDGVVSRRQLLAAGLTRDQVRKLVRKGRLTPVHRGVYADHTGPLSFRQRVWAADLACPGSVLAGRTVLAWAGVVAEPVVLDLAVEHGRPRQVPSGARVRQVRSLADRVQETIAPPRLRLEEAVLDVVADVDDRLKVISLITDVVRQRRTRVDRLRKALHGRARQRHRALLGSLLDDMSGGAHSVLEHGYLHRVERAHGLPEARRQLRCDAGSVSYRDVEYSTFGLIVELDGSVGHSRSVDRWHDMQRDLVAAADGKLTLRIGWRQVEHDPCETAALIGQVLAGRGWDGRPGRCGPACSVSRNFAAGLGV